MSRIEKFFNQKLLKYIFELPFDSKAIKVHEDNNYNEIPLSFSFISIMQSLSFTIASDSFSCSNFSNLFH